MSRDPYRSSAGDLGRAERWDRDRFYYERDRDRYGDVREEFDEEDDRVYTRSGPLPHRPAPPRRHPEPRRPHADDVTDRDSSRDFRHYDDDEGYTPRPRRRSPPPSEVDVDRRVFVDRERTYTRSPPPPRRRYAPSPSPPPPAARPGMLLRRTSSLDSFDRRPRGYHKRQEYPPPARRDDYRAPPYVPIPLPRTKALPPPRRSGELFEEDYYAEEDVRSRIEPPHRPHRRRRRDRSRESRSTRSRARSSRASSFSESSSSSDGGTSVRSEYPKKGKTRIPARLVSKRALVDLEYPFIEEGSTIVVLKALGQDNIDDLLRLSEEYKKSDQEIVRARSHTDEVIEERHTEVFVNPAPARAPVAAAPVEFVDATTAVMRAPSPTRTTTLTTTSAMTPYVVDATRPGDEMALMVEPHRHHRHRRSRSAHSKDVVRAERLPTGELVLYEEEIETVARPSSGVRIEKDKKGPPPALMKAMLAAIT